MKLVRHIYYICFHEQEDLIFLLLLGMGNCGWENNDGDLILAMSEGVYDANNGSNCGQVRLFFISPCYPR